MVLDRYVGQRAAYLDAVFATPIARAVVKGVLLGTCDARAGGRQAAQLPPADR